jgi:hypothetical protein
MIEILRSIIEYIGISNALTIFTFILSVFIAFYLYYKSFYRLIYSTQRVCENCNRLKEWTSNETDFISRIIFYNNGRKTITNKEIHNLALNSTGKINSLKTIASRNQTIQITTKTNKANIKIEYIDSSDFFVLEVFHKGYLTVEGRISETGNLLHTEPNYWKVINIAFMIFIFAMSFYNFSFLYDEGNPEILKITTNFFVLFSLFGVIRFIHSILFIPDRIHSKYLDTKDKSDKEFKN